MSGRRHAFRGDDSGSFLVSRAKVLIHLGPLIGISLGIWVLLGMGVARLIAAIAEALR